MPPYDPKSVEPKQQAKWAAADLYRVDDASPREKLYCLVEFPYPSGNLHVGHWYAFAVPDMYARFQWMRGKNVMYPIGFDAFGLPAERAAIMLNLNPRDWTRQNMAKMEEQLRSMGASFDWSRKVVTCEPEYYRWTQWLFLKLLGAGLAYQAETPVNWCPTDKTVLANEQVKDGRCDRCGTEVEQRRMNQWQLRITNFADALVDDLDALEWPEAIKAAQREWIGRSEGAEFDFKIEGAADAVTVFTTRADTLFGVTYVVLAPEHPLVQKLAASCPNHAAIEAYIAETGKKRELDRLAGAGDKTGVPLEGVFAVNPANGEKVPVWVADYVLGTYGTGAVMAVPAHDERDFAFAKKYGLSVRDVVRPQLVDRSNPHVEGQPLVPRANIIALIRHAKTGKYLCLKWKEQPWTTFVIGGVEDGEDPVEAAKREIAEEAGIKDARLVRVLGAPLQTDYNAAHKKQNRRSTTVPILFETDSEPEGIGAEELAIHEPFWMDASELRCGVITHAETDILMHRVRTGDDGWYGGGFLVNSGEFDGQDWNEARAKIAAKFGRPKTQYRLRDWLVSRQRYWGCPIPVIHCAACGVVGVPEDQLPVELPPLDSYLPADDGASPLARSPEFVNVKCPKCGADARRETDTLDTFIDSSWYYYRYADPKNGEAFASPEKLAKWLPVDVYAGGAEHTTMHVLFARFFAKALHSLGLAPASEPFRYRFNRSLILGPDGDKMSKSKGNVIDPDAEVERYGADTVRMYLAFMGPYAEVNAYPWDPQGIVGLRRFIERTWRACLGKQVEATPEETRRAIHRAIGKVTEDIPRFKLNTAIAALMTCLTALEKTGASAKDYRLYLRLVAPFAPHLADELWERLGGEGSVHRQAWPEADPAALVEATAKIAVQVDGKVRATLEMPAGAGEREVREAAESHPQIAKWISSRKVIKVVLVPNRLLSMVTEPSP
jgi:leucyl-tRNA synthetase